MFKKTIILLLVFFMTVTVSPAVSHGASKHYKVKRLVSQLYEKKTSMDAQRSLSSYGDEVTEFLLPLLDDKQNDSVRVAALNIIASVGDASAEDKVVESLTDRSYRVRQAAARTLSVIARKESTIEHLKPLLNDYYPAVRYNAVKALSGLVREEDTEVFISTLGDPEPRVRLFSVIALGKLKSREAVPYLAQLTRDYDPNVRLELANTFASINTEECLQPLTMLLSDPDVNVRMLAAKKLGETDLPGAEGPLVKAAGNPDPRVASMAIRALGARKSPKALEMAREGLNDEHMDVKLASLEVIGIVGGEEEEALLKPMLTAESTLVRKKAKAAMVEVSGRL